MKNQLIENGDVKAQVLGVGVTSTNLQGLLRKIADLVHSSHKSCSLVVTANPEIVMQARRDVSYKTILNKADLVFADGAGLRLAEPKLTVVPGRKLVQALAESKQYKLFFLGGQGGVADAMSKKYGGDSDSGEVNIAKPTRNDEILTKIAKAAPDLILVAYGAPWQEKWIWENRDKIKAKVAVGVGGSFDTLTGRVKFPPEWISQLGFECAWRLLREPWRWKRQLQLLKFAFLAFLGRVTR